MNDAIVVGGGPAGSATALLLARAGFDVRLIERARFPRRKVCGEYLNRGAVEALDRLGVLERVRPHATLLLGVRLRAAGAPPVVLPFARPALACPRALLDDVLLRAAQEAGASVERGRVEDVAFEGGRCSGVRVRRDDGTLAERAARLVIGADGIGSVVARRLGLARPAPVRARYALGGHYEGFDGLDGHIEMYADDGAYFALNPLGAERTNVMVVVPRARLAQWSTDVDAGMASAAERLGGEARAFAGARRVGARVSVGPLAHSVRAAAAPGALLVGDAAGFLDPFTGQGVFLALTSAERAALAAAAALQMRASEGAAFRAYARAQRRELAVRRLLARAVALLVDVPPLARRATARLARSPESGRVLLEALAGALPPERALSPAVLGRLLV